MRRHRLAPAMSDRAPIVGVMGGGTVPEVVEAQAERLGRQIAEHGWVLVTGGRRTGVMEAASRGAREAGGLTVGILPTRGPEAGQTSRHVQIPIYTGMGDARNQINVLTSQVVVALPGGAGTLSEVALALKAGRPVILVGWEPTDGLARLGAGRLQVVDSVEAAIQALEAHLG